MSFTTKRTPGDGWSKHELDETRRLFDQNVSVANIATHLGKTKNAVTGKLVRLGWKRPRPKHETSWTTEKRARISTLWGEGATAETISIEFGVTIHAIYKLARRMKLPMRKTTRLPGAPKPKRIRASRARTPRPKPVVIPPAPPAPSFGLPLMDLARYGCRYATGEDERGHLFCGNPQQLGQSYCPAHRHICLTGERVISPRTRTRADYVAEAHSRRFG